MAVVVLVGAALPALVTDALHRYTATTLPAVATVRVADLYIDTTPVHLTITAAWQKVSFVATRDMVLSDATLWRTMQLEDWGSVPAPLQRDGLHAVLARYSGFLSDPHVWDRLTPEDWDLVPHPIRVLAFRHMTEYWRGYYGVGDEHGIPPRLVSETLAAIVMAESWFEHRAVNTNPWGNRDVGVAQASDGARSRMRAWFHAGDVDVLLSDAHYFNPWHGTRFVAVWMKWLLDQGSGDLDFAVRAYHRGPSGAARGEGAEYLDVVRRRRRFLRDRDHPGAWGHLQERDRRFIVDAWPWLTAPRQGPERPAVWRPWLEAQPTPPVLVLPVPPPSVTGLDPG
jgi:hypothetical protein